MSDKTVVITSETVKVNTIGIQGPEGPNTILGKNVADGTVTANGSIINYNSTTDKWEATVAPTGLTIGGGNF
tara:strand:+ start:1462 stop:1677 length:216 start_codon:yes stop_codon:yes gene_type:complete